MPHTIQMASFLPAPPGRLYEMYLDPKMHAAFTGAAVTIDARPGSAFSAFDGMLSGSVLQAVPGRLIVQSWRAAHWPPDDMDSTLILTFWPEEGGGRIELTHVNVPDHDFAGVSQGWEEYYWTPWRSHLEKK